MSNIIRVAMHGDKQVMSRLKGVVPRLRRKVLGKAARIAMKPLLQNAKANAPKGKTGLLRKAIKLRAMKRSRVKVGVYIAIGDKMFEGQTFYGAFQEFGWRVGKRDKSLRQRGIWSGVGTDQDKRQEVPGRHYIEDAYKHGRAAAVERFTMELTAQLDTIAKGGM